MKTTYLITLAGAIDDIPVALLPDEAAVEKFLADNQPAPMDGADAVREGPLAEAMNLTGRGPSIVYGYQVWTFEDDKPVKVTDRRWIYSEWPGPSEYRQMTETDRANLHATEEGPPQIEIPPHHTEWDTTGGGPVG